MEKERKYAVFAKTRRRGTSRYRNSPICRQRKIPEDSAKGERERGRERVREWLGFRAGNAQKSRETENWRRGETRS